MVFCIRKLWFPRPDISFGAWFLLSEQGLGKDGSGIKEPVQAKAVDGRSGLGSQQKKTDPSLEAQAGDSYRTIIQKKAMARFREMA